MSTPDAMTLYPYGNGIHDAGNLFRWLIEDLGLAEVPVATLGDTRLGLASTPQGLLAHWMQRGDMLCVALFGRRAWDAVYVTDSQAALNLSVEPLAVRADDPQAGSYARYPVAGEADMTVSLKYLIARRALLDTLEIAKERVVDIYPVTGLFDAEGEAIVDHDVVPFPSQEEIIGGLLHGFLMDNRTATRHLNRRRAEAAEQARTRGRGEGLGNAGL